MRHFYGSWLVLVFLTLFGLATLLLSGCDVPTSLPTSVAGAPTDTPESQSQPTAIVTSELAATPPAPAVVPLTIWTTETFSPTQAITSSQILAEQVAAFEKNHPDVQVEFGLKKAHGKGGILDFLLTTDTVVPALLPDLAFIDVDELETAVQAGVVQPLDTLIPPDLVDDLYPFARQAGTFDGRLYGLQFQADLDHLVYNTGRLAVPPRSWPGVLSNPGAYLFPAGGAAGLVNDDFLVQYLAVRPWTSEEDPNEPFLDKDSLAAVLQYYKDGVSRGVFPRAIVDYHSTDDSFGDYVLGKASLAHVSAHRYLAERNKLTNSAMAPIPAINGAGSPIGRGWALALVTSDPARQSLAVELMTRLMSPQINAAWNKAADYLPTRQAALANWDEEDSYTRFVMQQLQTAQARPRMPNYSRIAAALQEAVLAVITGDTTPEEAAAQAIEKVQ
jgi:ABC-type glycerol-3-phosphate transport system substrate-binding protein